MKTIQTIVVLLIAAIFITALFTCDLSQLAN